MTVPESPLAPSSVGARSDATGPVDDLSLAALMVEDLRVDYTVRGVDRAVLRGVSFTVAPGEAYGLVGESGCGKSTTAYAALRYLPRNGKITAGRVSVAGREVTAMTTKELQHFRTHDASMVFQDPAQALNPSVRVGRQLLVEGFAESGLEPLQQWPVRLGDFFPLRGGLSTFPIRVIVIAGTENPPRILPGRGQHPVAAWVGRQIGDAMLVGMDGHPRSQGSMHPLPGRTVDDLLDREILAPGLLPVKQRRGNPDFIRDFDGRKGLHGLSIY